MKYLLSLCILISLSFSFNSYSSQMDVSSYGTTWIDTTGQFRFRSANNLDSFNIFEEEGSGLMTISFNDDSFIVVNTDTNEIARHNNSTGHTDYSMVGTHSAWNAPISVKNTMTAFYQHMEMVNAHPPEPDCPVILPPGEPCPIDIGINSYPSSFELPSDIFGATQSSQSSAFCQFMESKRNTPFNGHSSFDRCVRVAKYSHRFVAVSTVVACVGSGPTIVGGAIVCSAGAGSVTVSQMLYNDTQQSCLAGFEEVQHALEICDQEALDNSDAQSGGSIAPGVNMDVGANPAFDLYMSQTVTCVRVVTSINGEAGGSSQVICTTAL